MLVLINAGDFSLMFVVDLVSQADFVPLPPRLVFTVQSLVGISTQGTSLRSYKEVLKED